MGKIEKLVVLAVLFVSAIVVAVSLYGGGDSSQPQQPFGAGTVAAAEGGQDSEAADGVAGQANPRSWIEEQAWEENNAQGTRGSKLARANRREAQPTTEPQGDLLLSASPSDLGTTAARLHDVPAFDAQGRPRILRADANLREVPGVDTHRSYTVKQGDTWTSLSEAFFEGGTAHRELLQRQNEMMEELVPGQDIAVPVYDFLVRRESRKPYEARPVVTVVEKTAGARVVPRAATTGVQNGEYVVQSGDTLSEISQKVYGTSTRWREIYDANRGQLAGPDWLDVGMRLQIP